MKKILQIKKGSKREIADALALLTQIGITMVTCIVLMLLLGQFLDSKLGTSPWMTVVCILLGCTAAIRSMYTLTMAAAGKDKPRN